MKTTYFLYLIAISLISSFIIYYPSYSQNTIIGCINNAPVFRNEYDRLFKAELGKFQKKYIFNPWGKASYKSMKDRFQLIEEIESRNITFYPNDFETYKNIFEQKSQTEGQPINTYDLSSYAEDNARLLNYFRKNVKDKITNSIVERELASQEARKIGLRVEPWEINQRTYQIRAKYKSDQEFTNFLRINNSTELELRQSLEQQILFEKMQNKLNTYSSSGLISPEEQAKQFDDWFKKLKNESKIVFSLDGTDPALKLCAITQPKPKTVNQTAKARSITQKGKTKASNNGKKNLLKKFWKFGQN
ncbi:MAG: SurA N-terminal domain-containing protein [Candidatus Caenarcaniphilales bacterium]|nr:SurA N-terminal domain-containing protein [Candidatus Caenarcaniphilales bacterium]